MNCFSLIILVASAIVLASGQTADYCTISTCGLNPHIACGHTGAFDTSCPAGRRIVDVTLYIPDILNFHNSKRNLIAGGSVTPFAAASRMATVQWDSELSSLAELNVKQCVMAHDKCRNTDTFRYSGQNLAYQSYSGSESDYTDSVLVNTMMDLWWSENNVTTMAQINSYPSTPLAPPNVIGHFTAMACERQTRIGCAIARYFNTFNYFLMACNYASNNLQSWVTYTSGPTASACSTGANPSYPNLCSPTEPGYFL